MKINKSALQASLLAAFSLLLMACSTPYSCKMGMECISVEDSYKAAVANGGNKESVISYSERERAENSVLADSERSKTKASKKEGVFTPYIGQKITDKPVYQPPKPLRIWLAPWTNSDESGNKYLLSGQFMYVTTGGGWQLGEMGVAGQAADFMFKPHLPDALDVKRVNPKTSVVPQ